MELREIVEGKTRLLVPRESIDSQVPPKQPAFFNPNAKLSRDLSMVAYKAYLEKAHNRSIADTLASIGARAIRAVVEIEEVEEAYINDANSIAIEIAEKSSIINNVQNRCRFSVNEACRFLLEHATKNYRFGIVDLDPFGTPAPYADCALRALIDDGLLSITATDTPVLCGIYPEVSRRRYYGRAINTEYGNEIGLRLLLGMLSMIASRLEMGIKPLFVHSIRNHLRVYVKLEVGSKHADEMPSKLGDIYHCFICGNRGLESICIYCNKSMKKAGPLWIDDIFDPEFVKDMLNVVNHMNVNKICERIISMANEEIGMPLAFYSIDVIAEKLKITPPKMSDIIEALKKNGFKASRTSLRFTGFKTDAPYDRVLEVIKGISY